MLFQYYGLTFRRLEHNGIEVLRKWRNAAWIKPFMHDREQITPEMQDRWFRSIDNVNNWYFIIEREGEPIGAVYLRNIDLKKGVAEPGILMGEDDEGLMLPAAIAMLFQGVIGFYLFRLSSLIAHMYRSHSKSLSNHLKIGAKIIEEFGDNSVYVEITRTCNEAENEKLRNALATLYGEKDHIKITIEKETDTPEVVQFIHECLESIENIHRDKFQLNDSYK